MESKEIGLYILCVLRERIQGMKRAAAAGRKTFMESVADERAVVIYIRHSLLCVPLCAYESRKRMLAYAELKGHRQLICADACLCIYRWRSRCLNCVADRDDGEIEICILGDGDAYYKNRE
ncbi:hypothetical protein KP509_08G037300 [Ceratopteris richardii]|uniref:Uncharacterized protein n=1 Tax=Ceratopteris richardii TaxID=49495 RepID=A0A8T2U4V6_CERRI|nr:hypothetical protein KP509_08G037300 [Ceratopteris richardii]